MQNQRILDHFPPAADPAPLLPLAAINRNANVQQADDAALIQGCLAGDEQAWETLLARYGKLIYAIPYRFDLPRHIADEIFQEVCVILLHKLATLQDQTRLGSWLMTVTKRLCLQVRAKQQPMASLDDLQDLLIADDESEATLLRNEEYGLVRQALANLDSRSQQVLQTLFFRERPLSYTLLAEELGVHPSAIGPLRTRSLKKLEAELARLQATDTQV